MDVMKPILKWVGGKTQILDKVMSSFPKEINNYHEPFIGGGSVLLAFLCFVQDGHIKLNGKVYASDVNGTLIYLYKNIQTNPQQVIEKLKHITEQYFNIPFKVKNDNQKVNRKPNTLDEALQCQETYYYWIRQSYNKLPRDEYSSCLATAYFIFLNKTCFRGVHREGPNGFNVPFGNYKNPSIYNEDHLLIVSSMLNNVIFTNQSFEESLAKVDYGDFVYLDPPYVPENITSFVGYNKDSFTKEQHLKLFDICKFIFKEHDISFVMSNADVEIVRKTFCSSCYEIKIIKCKRAINCKKPNAQTNELLIKFLARNQVL
jgi:DNA adenine methylase